MHFNSKRDLGNEWWYLGCCTNRPNRCLWIINCQLICKAAHCKLLAHRLLDPQNCVASFVLHDTAGEVHPSSRLDAYWHVRVMLSVQKSRMLRNRRIAWQPYWSYVTRLVVPLSMWLTGSCLIMPPTPPTPMIDGLTCWQQGVAVWTHVGNFTSQNQ